MHYHHRINRKQKLDQCPVADISVAVFTHRSKVRLLIRSVKPINPTEVLCQFGSYRRLSRLNTHRLHFRVWKTCSMCVCVQSPVLNDECHLLEVHIQLS